tara:strand:- start:1235 stop:1777 length:543 start_codon:yes stop_codon:yes gene_type:complete
MIFIKENFISEKKCQEIIDQKVSLVQPVDYAEFVDEYGEVNEVTDVKERDRKSDITTYRDLNLRYDIIHFLSTNLNLDFHQLDEYETFHFIRYSESDHFAWHNDVTRKKEYYTGIISLNDSYEGGELLYRDSTRNIHQFIKKAGTLILFPANTYHAVKKITKGTRFSLATWFFSKHKTLI